MVPEPQAGITRGGGERVERVGRVQRIVARERLVVRNPGTHDPFGADRLHFRECAARIVAQAFEADVRGAAAQLGAVEGGAHRGDGVAPEAGAFDLAETELARPGKRSRKILGQIFAQAPELQTDRTVEVCRDLSHRRRNSGSRP